MFFLNLCNKITYHIYINLSFRNFKVSILFSRISTLNIERNTIFLITNLTSLFESVRIYHETLSFKKRVQLLIGS